MTIVSRIRTEERGQSVVFAAIFMTVLLGMTGFVVDVGAWFRADRHAQAQADAAALAGAQLLPESPAAASATAIDYGQRNGTTVLPADIAFTSRDVANDTISVKVEADVPGFFSRVLGIFSQHVGANASARSYQPQALRWVAPIVVNKLHPKLLGSPDCPCYGPENETTLPLGKTGAPGAFGMLDLDDSGGATGASTLAAWIEKGFDDYLPLGGYYSDPGAKFGSSSIENALEDRYGTELLFPVFDTLTGNGANAKYHIIAWVGFHLTDSWSSGNDGELTGWFTRVIWDGLDAVPGGTPGPDLGVRSVQLVQ